MYAPPDCLFNSFNFLWSTHSNTLHIFVLQPIQSLGGDERSQLFFLHLLHQLWMTHHVWAAKSRLSASDLFMVNNVQQLHLKQAPNFKIC